MALISKWKVAWLLAGYLALMTIATFLLQGFTEEAIRSLLRVTARSSLILFLLAFSASSLQLLFRNNLTSWILSNRRYIGISFAFSHGIHLLLLFVLAIYFPYPFLDELNTLVLVVGGLAYAFIIVMTITSFAQPRKWLGERRWKLLHTSGSYYVWFVFAQSYASNALENLVHASFTLALLLAFALRVAGALKRIKKSSPLAAHK